MKDKPAKVFLLITSFFSILILLIGTTFSYFSLSNQSELNALAATANEVRINLAVSDLYTGHALIPLKDELVSKAYDRKCVDDLGRGACLAYTLELFNYSKEHEVQGIIDFAINDIENLSYMVLDENGEVYLDVTHIDSTASTGLTLGDSFMLLDGSGEISTTKKFILIVWLTDNNEIQNETDASGYFNATVTFTSTDGGRLTATVQGMKSSVVETSLID